MSDVQNTTAAETHVSEPIVAQKTEPIEDAVKAEHSADTPAVESAKPEETVTEAKDESAPAEEKKDEAAAAKPVEPISEGQLAVKAPGFIKSILPSKREFWLSDDAVSPKDLGSYMRGEKAEISHDVVAWASQTGKGLLFFNKKGESKKQPGHVLALYDATDLKKQAPHEISFKLNNEQHLLKATSDSERDGWYLTIERAIETGKAIKDETRESEGYKAEKEKLDKPHVPVVAAAAAKPKKSMEADKTDPERKNSDIEQEDKKDKKSRSTSRGVLDRLKSKKDEKKEEKTEKKTETEESKPEEEHKTEEATAGVAAAGAAGAGAVVIAEGSSSEDKKDTETSPTESKTEEKPKPQKRGSIFGKMQAGFGSLRSPQKEKEEKDAELKPEVPPKDEPVSDEPPQIPATNVEGAEESKAEEAEAKPSTPEEKKDATTPSKEKKNFLSGLSFVNKRNRSVSPTTPMKDAPAKTEEAAAAEVPKEAEPVEEGKADEAIAETTAVEPLKPATGTEEIAKKEKRESVLGSLGRRASKAFKNIQGPAKKENAAPATEAKKEETAVAEPAKEEPSTNGEVKKEESAQPNSIGDVVPDAVNVGKPENQPAAVTASA